MVSCSPQAVKRLILQFRWRKLRNPDIAQKQAVAGINLKRVAIDHFHQGLGRNHHITGIYVADDMTPRMDGFECTGEITRGMNQKRPVGVWEGAFAMRRAVQAVDFVIAVDPGHHETDQRAVRAGTQHIHRPGGDFQQARMRVTGHAFELLGFARLDWLVIDFGDKTGPTRQLVDRAFTTTPQRVTRLDPLPVAAMKPRHRCLLVQTRRNRDQGRWSCE